MEYFKIPYKTICGICCGFIAESDNPKGDLAYDGCEEPENYYDGKR